MHRTLTSGTLLLLGATLGACGSGVEPDPHIASILVLPPAATVFPGGAQRYSAIARDAAGSQLRGVEFAWSASWTGSTTVATVDAGGLATGMNPGEATITATANGVNGSSHLTVAPQPPGSWNFKASMPGPRMEMPGVVLNGRIYVIGGIHPDSDIATATEIYDPSTDSWATGAPLPVPRHHHSVVELGGRIYVIGGYSNLASPFWQAHADMFAFDPATGAWTSGPPMPAARGAMAAAAHGGLIYVFGGALQRQPQSTTFIFDPGSQTWSTGPPMPTAREHHSAVTIGDVIYVVAGRVEAPSLVSFGELEVYLPLAGSWDSAPSLPLPRSGLGAAAMNGRLYVFGGEIPGATVYANAEEFDPAASVWRELLMLPAGRTGAAVVALGNTIHVIGGGAPGNTPFGSNFVFTLP